MLFVLVLVLVQALVLLVLVLVLVLTSALLGLSFLLVGERGVVARQHDLGPALIQHRQQLRKL
jgi:hypothetical protein